MCEFEVHTKVVKKAACRLGSSSLISKAFCSAASCVQHWGLRLLLAPTRDINISAPMLGRTAIPLDSQTVSHSRLELQPDSTACTFPRPVTLGALLAPLSSSLFRSSSPHIPRVSPQYYLASHSGCHIHFKLHRLISKNISLALSGVSKRVLLLCLTMERNFTPQYPQLPFCSCSYLLASISGYTPESSFDPNSRFLILPTKSRLYVTYNLTHSYRHFTYTTAPSFFPFRLTYPEPHSGDHPLLQRIFFLHSGAPAVRSSRF
jgi:hypothetical protein